MSTRFMLGPIRYTLHCRTLAYHTYRIIASTPRRLQFNDHLTFMNSWDRAGYRCLGSFEQNMPVNERGTNLFATWLCSSRAYKYTWIRDEDINERR
jgi:hypothetical protein